MLGIGAIRGRSTFIAKDLQFPFLGSSMVDTGCKKPTAPELIILVAKIRDSMLPIHFVKQPSSPSVSLAMASRVLIKRRLLHKGKW